MAFSCTQNNPSYSPNMSDIRIVVYCLLWLLPTCLVAQTASDYMRQGMRQEQRGDSDGAIASYSQALALDAHVYMGYQARGQVKDKKGDFDGAISDFDQAIANNATDYLSYELRADAKRHKADFDRIAVEYEGAIDDYNHSLILNPLEYGAYIERGECKERIDDLSGALKDYNQGIQLHPKGADAALAYMARGILETATNNLDAASADLSKAIELDPNNPECVYSHGDVSCKIGFATRDTRYFDIAIADYSKAIQLNPNEYKFYNGLGLARFAHADFNGAASAFKEANALNPKAFEVYFNMGLLQQAEGNTSLASEYFDKAMSLKRASVAAKTPSRSNSPSINNNEAVELGTGFFVTSSGYLLTDLHVVKGASNIRVKAGTVFHSAILIAKDVDNDIALLKVDGNYSCLPLGDSSAVVLGQSVFTIGFPEPELQGLSPKFTKGDISSLAGAQDDPRVFQVSVPVQPGNSGGCLVDESGDVVGLIESTLSTLNTVRRSGDLLQNVNYATKISYAKSLLDTVPEAKSGLLPAYTKPAPFPDQVKNVQQATVFIIAGS
jgi:tetratricopeptide (TPR) repeat protein